jgi:hypothetical protein
MFWWMCLLACVGVGHLLPLHSVLVEYSRAYEWEHSRSCWPWPRPSWQMQMPITARPQIVGVRWSSLSGAQPPFQTPSQEMKWRPAAQEKVMIKASVLKRWPVFVNAASHCFLCLSAIEDSSTFWEESGLPVRPASPTAHILLYIKWVTLT